MDFNQNQKINQVTEKTLVVGMDIAKYTHYASFVDDRGRILHSMKEKGKTEVIVGIEPTGHYWLSLAYFLEDVGILLVMTNSNDSLAGSVFPRVYEGVPIFRENGSRSSWMHTISSGFCRKASR